jgi:hypothetical protein
MRRLPAVALILAILTWAGAGLAGAQTSTTVSPLGPHDCSQTKLSFLFWPSGHGASTQYSFPAFPTPHVEVYSGAPYQNAQFLLYFSSTGSVSYSPSCAPAAGSSAKTKAMKSSKKQTANALIECSFKTDPTLAVVPGTGSSTMTVVVSGQTVATIELGTSASTARYDAKACTSKPPIA